MVKAPGGGQGFLDKFESLNREGPRDWDRFELLGGDMFLLGKELALLIGSHDSFCVFDRSGPVKPLSKGFTYQSIWRCMVATSP